MNIRSGAVTLIAIVAVGAVAWFLLDGARRPALEQSCIDPHHPVPALRPPG